VFVTSSTAVTHIRAKFDLKLNWKSKMAF
jgi:hypothetical protein